MSSNHASERWLHQPAIADSLQPIERENAWKSWLLSTIPKADIAKGKPYFIFDQNRTLDSTLPLKALDNKWKQKGELPRYLVWKNVDQSINLGQGGMGITYQGYDLNLRRPVAVKGMNTDQLSNYLSFNPKDSAVLIARLTHLLGRHQIHIPTIFSVLQDPQQFPKEILITMELVKGVKPLEYLKHDPRHYLTNTASILTQLSDTLTASQQMRLRGINDLSDKPLFHLDIKPSNMLVNDRGFVTVIDWDLAGLALEGHYTHGTISYMPPERLLPVVKKPTEKSEIYAYAVTAYNLLSGGRHPYGVNDSDDNETAISKIFNDPYIPLPEDSPGYTLDQESRDSLDQLLSLGLNRDLQDRPDDLASYNQELCRLLIQINRRFPFLKYVAFPLKR